MRSFAKVIQVLLDSVELIHQPNNVVALREVREQIDQAVAEEVAKEKAAAEAAKTPKTPAASE